MCIDGIEITDIIVFPIKGKSESNIKAHAKIILNDSLIMSGLKIIQCMSKKKYYIRFPQDIKGIDIAYPIRASLRTYISNQVITHYENIGGAL